MVDTWFREYGFHSNPFSIKPAAFTNDVIGHNLKSVFKNIESGKLTFVLGPYGTGKTTILKNIIGKFGGHGKVIYFSCGLERSMDVQRLLRGAGSLLDRLTGVSARDIIFLVDEANDLLSRDAADLYGAYRDGAIKSIVFVGTDVPTKCFPPGLSTDIKDRIINLHNLPSAAAVQLVRSRVGNLPLLTDKIVRELHRRASGNTRLLLEYCEDLCRLCVSRGLFAATKQEIDELFPAPAQPIARKQKKVPARKEVRPLDQAIEEAVFEGETDQPVVEGLAQIRDSDPLPGTGFYESPLAKKRKKKS